MEDAEIHLRRGAECYVSGRAWNLRYGVINTHLCELCFMFTLGFFSHRFAPPQCLLSMTLALGALFDILISITSGPSGCADLSKRACPLAM